MRRTLISTSERTSTRGHTIPATIAVLCVVCVLTGTTPGSLNAMRVAISTQFALGHVHTAEVDPTQHKPRVGTVRVEKNAPVAAAPQLGQCARATHSVWLAHAPHAGLLNTPPPHRNRA